MLKKIYNILYYSFLFVIFLLVFLLILSRFENTSYRILIVRSGSMEPTISTGSLILINRQKDYKVGDIITFSSSNKHKIPTTHRIVKIEEKQGEIYYQSKGDANKNADFNLVPKERVLGKTIFSIPYLGYLLAKIKTKTGFFFAVLIPALLIIASELKNIFNVLKNKNAKQENK